MGASDVAARAAFSVLLVLSLFPAWFVALAGAGVEAVLPEPKRAAFREGMATVLILTLALGWRLVFLLCPWMRVTTDGLDGPDGLRATAGASGRPCILLMNHFSFLDSILSVACFPLAKAGGVRVLVANYVFAIPLLGRVMRCMGLPEVPFKGGATEVDNMKVDMPLMDERLKAFEEHVRAGGTGAWFPEGIRNRGDPRKLQAFRAGAFAVPARLDVEVWCMTLVGTEVAWPARTQLGGSPARIGLKCRRLCESSQALLAAAPLERLEQGANERARAVYLAEHTRESMQVALDELVAEGFVEQALRSEGGGSPAEAAAQAQSEATLRRRC